MLRRVDIISGCVLALVGLVTVFVIIPREISGHSDYGLAPDFFPRILIWLFIFLAALLAAHRLLRAGTHSEDGDAPMSRLDWLYIAGVSVFLVPGYVAMDRFGFIAAGIPMVALITIAMGGHHNRLRTVLVAIGAPVLIYLAFEHLFSVYLP